VTELYVLLSININVNGALLMRPGCYIARALAAIPTILMNCRFLPALLRNTCRLERRKNPENLCSKVVAFAEPRGHGTRHVMVAFGASEQHFCT